MFEDIAVLIVMACGLYLVGLGCIGLWQPERVERFLLGHASSLRWHLIEMGLRLLAGAALVGAAPRLAWPMPAAGFGWLLVVTSVVLLFLPWRWHQRFAAATVPRALPHLRWFAPVAVLLGGCILAAILLPR